MNLLSYTSLFKHLRTFSLPWSFGLTHVFLMYLRDLSSYVSMTPKDRQTDRWTETLTMDTAIPMCPPMHCRQYKTNKKYVHVIGTRVFDPMTLNVPQCIPLPLTVHSKVSKEDNSKLTAQYAEWCKSYNATKHYTAFIFEKYYFVSIICFFLIYF